MTLWALRTSGTLSTPDYYAVSESLDVLLSARQAVRIIISLNVEQNSDSDVYCGGLSL